MEVANWAIGDDRRDNFARVAALCRHVEYTALHSTTANLPMNASHVRSFDELRNAVVNVKNRVQTGTLKVDGNIKPIEGVTNTVKARRLMYMMQKETLVMSYI